MIIITNNKVLKRININGIALWPFLFTAEKKLDKILLNHEKIHHRQQTELLLIFFYVLYILEWLIRFAIYRNHELAYRHISFEREAYAYENDFDYLNRRPFASFLKYMF